MAERPQIIRQYLKILALCVLSAVVHWVAPPQAHADVKAEIAETETFLRLAKHAPASETLPAHVKLGTLFKQAGDRKKAEAQWILVIKAYEKAIADKNPFNKGGEEAAAAAESAVHLLELKVQAFMEEPIPPLPAKFSPIKRQAILLTHLRILLDTQIGTQKNPADPAQIPLDRAGGFIDEMNDVDGYRVAEWSFGVKVLRGRICGQVSEIAKQLVLTLPPEEQDGGHALVDPVVAHYADLAMAMFRATWQDMQRHHYVGAWMMTLKKILNLKLPNEFPLSRERVRQWQAPLPNDWLQQEILKTLQPETVRACYDRVVFDRPDEMFGDFILRWTVTDEAKITEIVVENEPLITKCLQQRWGDLKGVPGAGQKFKLRLQFAVF